MHRRCQGVAYLAGACLALLPGPARADLPVVKVIPPGNEALVMKMLSGELPGGCKLDDVALDRTKVVATYKCPKTTATLELHHPSDGAGAEAKTAQFSLVPKGALPAGLLDAVKAGIAANEGSWRWVSAEAPGLGKVAPDGPTPPSADTTGISPEESEALLAGVALSRQGKFDEAFQALTTLARRQPRHGVLGNVVAALASSSPDRARADKLAAEADQNPSDVLAQFVAGVGAHYCGHLNGKTRAEKLELYRRAIKYLERARPTFDFEPRVFVYLAISHFRLGEQKPAEELIEKAIPLAVNDPDVYYCRAEILQNVDPRRAVADIRKYLEMVDALHSQGVPISETKHRRVQKMLEFMEAVARGEKKPAAEDEWFDPLPGADPTGMTGPSSPGGASPAPSDSPTEAPAARPHRMFGSPAGFAALTLGVACVIVGLYMVVRRRKE